MPNKHYVFWPFTSDSYTNMGGEKSGAGRQLREFRRPNNKGNVSYVRYGSKKHAGCLAKCNAPDKSLYVTGHGAVGAQVISNTPDGSDDVVHALVVVMRLIEYGLKNTSCCKLKLFSCYSGVDGAGGFSFAKAVHLCLRRLGYNNIEVYGYSAAIGTYVGDHTIFIGVHPDLPQFGSGMWKKASVVRAKIDEGYLNDLEE